VIERIGGSALAREAMLAALKGAGERLSASGAAAGGVGESSGLSSSSASSSSLGAPGVDFERALSEGVREVDAKVQGADALPADLLTGKVGDFHEIAVQLKSTELSFKFALEIRNKLVDAYREVMRMQV